MTARAKGKPLAVAPAKGLRLIPKPVTAQEISMKSSTAALPNAMDEVSTMDIRAAQQFLNEIAAAASAIQCMASDIVEDGNPETSARGVAARMLANQVGWMADMAIARLGEPGVYGSPTDWMMPPSYRDALSGPRAVGGR